MGLASVEYLNQAYERLLGLCSLFFVGCGSLSGLFLRRFQHELPADLYSCLSTFHCARPVATLGHRELESYGLLVLPQEYRSSAEAQGQAFLLAGPSQEIRQISPRPPRSRRFIWV